MLVSKFYLCLTTATKNCMFLSFKQLLSPRFVSFLCTVMALIGLNLAISLKYSKSLIPCVLLIFQAAGKVRETE